MSKELQKIKNDIIHFIAEHGINTYKDAAQIPFNEDSDDEQKFAELITLFNYFSRQAAEGAQKVLPVLVWLKDGRFGRFYIQYTNRLYVAGYRMLEDDNSCISVSGETISEALENLWIKVSEKTDAIDKVEYSEEENDVLNNLDNII